MKKVRLIDGNNRYFYNMALAVSENDTARRCCELHMGFDIVFWVFDGLDSRKPRRELFAEYKETASRKQKRNDPTRYEYLNSFKYEKLKQVGGVILLNIPFLEADDVIAYLSKYYSDKGYLVEISSNDADLLALTRFKNVTQPLAKMPKNCSPETLTMFKTLVGDSGDNIKGMKGFGEAAWEKLSTNDLSKIDLALNDQVAIESLFFEDEKLKEKLIKQWHEIELAFKLVSPIPISDELIEKNLIIYPKNQGIMSLIS